jgi:hypothetical protein
LEASTGRDVVNEGVPGYGSIQNMRNMAAYGLPLEPEVVIWAYFINDPTNDYNFQAWLASGDSSYGDWQRERGAIQPDEPTQPNPSSDSLAAFLAENSRVYGVVDLAIQTHREEYIPYVDDSLDLRFRFYPVWSKHLNSDNPLLEYSMTLVQFNILEGKRLADEHGAAFLLVLIPPKEQVYWSIISRYVDNSQDYDVDGVTNTMLEFCAANDLTCIDLLPGFRTHAEQGEQLYFRSDPHWNEAGHALAADLILESLAEHDLLP